MITASETVGSSGPAGEPPEPSATIGINRRNGKQRSCEPCRKIKTRCDHNVPVCRRCRVKGIAEQCYYHPAPLTQPQSPSRPASRTQSQSQSQSHSQSQSQSQSRSNNLNSLPAPMVTTSVVPPSNRTAGHERLPNTNSTSIDPALPSPLTAKPLLGHSASVASAFPALWPRLAANSHTSSAQLLPELQAKSTTLVDEMRVSEVLNRLAENIDMVLVLVTRWYEVSQMCILPPQLIHEALPTLQPTVNRLSLAGANTAIDVLNTTLKPFTIPSDITPSGLSSLFTAPNLRLETIGLLLTTAGLAAQKLPHSDPVYLQRPFNKAEREAFSASMLSASNTCLSICDKYFLLNDVVAWLRAENLSLVSNAFGTNNHRTWQRSGQLFNDIFALNMHRESEDGQSGPTLLGQIRSRLFASAYRIDKAISTVYERPPRLPQHYCDRRLPLHLRDDNLTASDHSLQSAIDSINENGWSPQPHFHPTTWLRARYILSTFREQILNVQLGFGDSNNNEALLRKISQEIHDAWSRLPAYVHYDAACWDTNPDPNICFMLVVVYLDYLDLIFAIEKILYIQFHCSDAALLQAAASVLSTTRSASRHLSRNSGAYVDYVWILIFHGLPSATLLAMALKKSASLGANVMHPLSWQDVYRQLSALASDLDSIGDQGGDSDSPLRKGSKFLLDTLDEALNARIGTPGPTAPPPVPAVPSPAAIPMAFEPGEDLNFLDVDEGAFVDMIDCFGPTEVAGLDFTYLDTGVIWGSSAAL